MRIIDDEGRLFGVVNVVDFLVVLLVIALVVVGAGLVAGGGGQPEPVENRTATLVFSSFTEEEIGILTDAENLSLEEAGQIADLRANVTDTHVTPVPGQERATLFVAVQYRGTERLPVDRRIRVGTEEFTFNGTVTRVGGERTLPTAETAVTVEATVPSGQADAVDAGDRRTVDGQPVATITSVTRLFERDGQTRLLLGLDLQTIQRGGLREFAGRPLRLGTTTPFSTGEYALSGSIVRLGAAEVQQRDVSVRAETTVRAAVADAVTAGDTVRLGNETLATVESVGSSPASESDRRLLRLGVRLQAVAVDGETRFLGQPVRVGSAIPIRTGQYEFDATVTGVGQPQGETVERTVEVAWENVRPDVADGLRAGMTVQSRGTDAQITGLETEPATVVLTSESGEIFARQHPVNEDLTLTLSVEARQTESSLVFQGRPLQSGRTVVLDFGTVSVDGTVTSVEDD